MMMMRREEYQDLFSIVGCIGRKNHDAYSTDLTMKQETNDPKLEYTWECVVSIFGDNVSTSEDGINFTFMHMWSLSLLMVKNASPQLKD